MNPRLFPFTCVRLVVSCVAVLSFSTVHAVARAPRSPQSTAESDGLPDAPGKELVERACSVCHGLNYLVPSDRTVPQWRDTLGAMRTAGAQANDEEWKAIVEYFMANLAYLSMNKATADDIRLVFGVNEKIAEAVVAYRDKEGSFKTIEDLKKVPDLDPKKVDALKARLIFATN